MPTYKITAPNGAVYRVTGNGTEQEALAQLQAQLTLPEADPTTALGPSGPGVTADVAASLGAALKGAEQGTGNVLRGLAELGLMGDERRAVESQGGFQNFPAPDYAATKAAHPYATGFGESAPYAAAGAAASLIPGAQGFWPAILSQAAAGGLIGAARPGTLGERASRAGADAALGGLGGAIAGGLGAVANRALRPEVTMMRNAGVVPTVGQTLGGIPSRIEEAAGSLPVVGHMIDAARQRARNEFNVGAINRALESTGQTVTAPGHVGIQAAQQSVDDAYRAARAAAPGGLPFDAQARQEIGVLRNFLGRATQETERDFDRFYAGTFQRHLGRNAGFETRSFKELDAELGRKIRAAGASNQQLQSAFKELQRILRDSAGRVNPAYREAQGAADLAAARLMRVENAANRGANTEGVFTPGQLNMATRQMDTSSRRRASAAGDALMQDFASAGQTVLGDRVANSGTPIRMMTSGGLLGLSALLEPGTLAAALAALIGAGRPAQQAMNATMRAGQYAPRGLNFGLGQLGQGDF